MMKSVFALVAGVEAVARRALASDEVSMKRSSFNQMTEMFT